MVSNFEKSNERSTDERQRNIKLKSVIILLFLSIKLISIFIKGLSKKLSSKKSFKIIYENEEYELQEYINIQNSQKEQIEIKLKGINNIINMSGMFYECKSLSS